MEYERRLDLPALLKQKSFFLFGPRATGKTHLIRDQLSKKIPVIDLLRSDYFLRLSHTPSDLETIIAQSKSKTVVIDEVQKIPALLDEVHRLIEEKHIRFLLTGSSARKLKRGHANMLAGRAWTANLFPLTTNEMGSTFDLNRYLRFGGLPAVCTSKHPEEELDAYVQNYLKEEILSEGLIRKLPPFSRFLKTAALSNGQMINFTQVGSDAQVAPATVREYYSVLEDTLIGFLLEPWTASKKRKAIQMAKFYFFDPGVTHTLTSTKNVDRNSDLYGCSFEQFIGMELRAYLSYRRIKEPLTYWRSTHGHEVDYLVGEKTAIEVKSTGRTTPQHEHGLRALQEEKVFKKYYLITQDTVESFSNGIIRLHWKTFLQKLWNNKIDL